MLFSGIGVGKAVAIASGSADVDDGADTRWKKISELMTRATADTSKVTTSAILGQRGKLIGRTADACFDLFPRLSFSGTCGLPRLSL